MWRYNSCTTLLMKECQSVGWLRLDLLGSHLSILRQDEAELSGMFDLACVLCREGLFSCNAQPESLLMVVECTQLQWVEPCVASISHLPHRDPLVGHNTRQGGPWMVTSSGVDLIHQKVLLNSNAPSLLLH